MQYQRSSSPMNPMSGSTPPGIKWLLIINVVLFLLMPVMGGLMEQWLAFSPEVAFLIWQFITYAFLHGSFGHIFFNMFAVWMFGRGLEYRWGTKAFLRFYLTCAAGAALVHLLASIVAYFVFHRPPVPVIGASGAVMGLLMAYAMLYGEETVYVYFVLPMKMKYFVVIVGLLDVMGSWGELTGGGQSSIAHMAHLGGLLTGWLYIKFGGWDGMRRVFGPRRPRIVRSSRVRRPYMEDDTWR